MQVQVLRTGENPAHGFKTRIFFLGRRFLAVGFGFAEKAMELGQRLFVLVFGGLVGVAVRRAEAAARLPVGPVEVDAVVGADSGIFPVPGVELHHGGGAGDQAAGGYDLRLQHPLRAHGGLHIGIGVVGHDGTGVGVEAAGFGVVDGGAHGLDFHQAQAGVGGDEPRVYVFARGVEYSGIFRPVQTNRGRVGYEAEFALFKGNGAVGDHLAVAQLRRGAEDEDGAGLRRGGGGGLGGEG